MDDEAGIPGGVDRARTPAPPRRRRWGRRSSYGWHDASAGYNGHRLDATSLRTSLKCLLSPTGSAIEPPNRAR